MPQTMATADCSDMAAFYRGARIFCYVFISFSPDCSGPIRSRADFACDRRCMAAQLFAEVSL